ncbi:MAG: abortive infection family protein [Acidobacteria bacterium]|nr:abortive infection family protein [Acidobacteriota bacterium]
MKISEITRRDIIDAMRVDGMIWHGRLEEADFLGRIFDLERLPSTDSRFKDAAADIWQHRVNNSDWDDIWVFDDTRFNLMRGDDEVFLRFLCETLHPVVRPDVTDAQRLCQTFNIYLKNDGFRLSEKTRISGKPVFVGRYVGFGVTPGISHARTVLVRADEGYVAQQITRMEGAALNDPDLAIGTAKELLETCCRTILADRGITVPKSADLPQLVRLAGKELQLTPDDIPEKAKAAETIKRLLSNLGTIAQGIAELRNQYGTGHGRAVGNRGLSSRHAKLAVGAAATLAVFLIETHQQRPRPTTPSK